MKPMEHYARFLAYEVEANTRAMDSIAGVPAANRANPAYLRVLGVAAHIQIARSIWLERIGGTSPAPPADWFPPQPLDRTRSAAAENDRNWHAFLGSLATDALDSTCVYTSSEGDRYRSLVEDIITHVFNHSTYHRGQIATLVTQCGGERARTDFIIMTRDRL